MHPAHEVAVALDNHSVAIIAHPRRDSRTESGPFVCRPLGVAVDLHRPVIELEHAVCKLGLAESGAGFDRIYDLAVHV